MKQAHRKRKLLVPLLILLVLVIGLLVGLVYFKLVGLKSALQDLVAYETDDNYSLTIGKASVQITKLSFTFDSLVITRNPSLPETGIREAFVPKMQLRAANFWSMFRTRKFDIKTLIIDEPLIEIDNHKKEESNHEKFHLGQQILKLYPAVESILLRFNIQYLKINSGGLGVKNHPNPPLNLSLVDFLIEEWNAGKMDESGQLQLLIGEQELHLEKARVSFSAIEYNFRQRQLSINNVGFFTVDSVSKSHIDLEAKTIVLDKLGYNDLFEHQILTYEKVTIQNPIVDLHLFLNRDSTKTKVETNEKVVITRIIQQTIGEVNIDTLVIQKAAINLVLQKEQDSTLISVPQVDFTLFTFQVNKDSNEFITGNAEIELDKTSIALTDGITISCQKLTFDQQRNLIFEDVELYDAANKMLVVDCQLLRLDEFHLLSLIFDKQLLVKTIEVEDAVINIPSENIFGSSKKGGSGGLHNILIQGVRLKNVALNYRTKGNSFEAKGLSMDVINLKKDKGLPFEYQLSDIHVADATVHLEEKQLDAKLQDIAFEGKLFSAKKIQLKQQKLDVELAGISAVHQGKVEQFKNLDYTNWDALNANSISVTGTLPEKKTAQKTPDTTKFKSRFTVAQVAVKHLAADLKNADFAVTFGGDNIIVDLVSVIDGQFEYKTAAGTLANVKLNSKKLTVTAKEIDVQMPKALIVTDLFVLADKLAISAPKTTITHLEKLEKNWAVQKINLSSLLLKKNGHNMISAESILIKNLVFGGEEKPYIGFVEAHKPIFTFNEKHKNQTPHKKPNLDFLNMLGDFVLHPGSLVLPKQKISFGKISGNARNKTIALNDLKTELEKMHLSVKHVSIDKYQLDADTLILTPNKKWYANHNYAQSILTTKLYHARVTGFSMDSILAASKFENLHVDVNGFYLFITKDFRLPDPPFKEKPSSLIGLLNFPNNISVKSIAVSNGEIDVEQISAKTSEKGELEITGIWADAEVNYIDPKNRKIFLTGGAKLCDQGKIELKYNTIDADMFALSVSVTDFDMTRLNKMITPLLSIEIKSGHLVSYNINVTANNDRAVGEADITYDDLHMIIYKKSEPEKKNIGSEMLTFLADGLVIRNSKENATTTVLQLRTKQRTTFDYWIKTSIHGAVKAIKEGKSHRNR